jgi:hypothetical protein
MKKLLTLFLMLQLAVPAAPASDVETLLRSVDEIVADLARMRGMPPKGPIARGVKSKEDIRAYLVGRLAEEYPREEVEIEARVLRRLGLIPEDLQLYDFMIELMTEQIAGYYDPFEDVLYLADWLPPLMQRPVLAHELTHALQDQYFDLDRFMARVDGDDDRTAARNAVFEGEAILAMLGFAMPGEVDVRRFPDPVELHLSQLPLMEAEYPLFAAAPAYIKLSMLFPYAWGARFVQRFLQEHPWSEIGRLYEAMPESSEQSLHPHKYFDEPDPPRQVAISGFEGLPEGFDEVLYSNVLGEFLLRQALAQHLTPAEAEVAAAGWDGDRLELRRHTSGAEALIFRSIWDSPDDAREFAGAWRAAADRRLGAGGWECSGEDAYFREVDGRRWTVRVSGEWVEVLEIR